MILVDSPAVTVADPRILEGRRFLSGAFQFTMYQRMEEDCYDWFEWFRQKGIECAIVYHENHSHDFFRFAVIRHGQEQIPPGSNKMRMTYIPERTRIVRATSGFQLVFSEE